MKTPMEEMIQWTIENAFNITAEDGTTIIAIDHEEMIAKFDSWLLQEKQQTIELPSNEEIAVIALNISDTLKDSLNSREEAFYLAGFQTCAKWMKRQILKQTK